MSRHRGRDRTSVMSDALLDDVSPEVVSFGFAGVFAGVGSYITVAAATCGLSVAASVAPWAVDHLLRSMRSYNSDAQEQKIRMLNNMDEASQQTFLTDVKQQHSGKSGVFTSTKTSKEFDGAKKVNSNPKASDFDALKDYVDHKAKFFGKSGPTSFYRHNSGRTLFNTVMHTRSPEWMSDALNQIPDKDALIQAIVKQYQPSSSSSQVSKNLSAALKDGTINADKKIDELQVFLKSSEVAFKKNDKNFKMLEIIEREIARRLPASSNTNANARW